MYSEERHSGPLVGWWLVKEGGYVMPCGHGGMNRAYICKESIDENPQLLLHGAAGALHG